MLFGRTSPCTPKSAPFRSRGSSRFCSTNQGSLVIDSGQETWSDPSISSVTRSIMIATSNSPVKGSGYPINDSEFYRTPWRLGSRAGCGVWAACGSAWSRQRVTLCVSMSAQPRSRAHATDSPYTIELYHPSGFTRRAPGIASLPIRFLSPADYRSSRPKPL
jgi:hypothetical protein